MSNSVFKKWTNAVRHLNEKIKNNRLIAGRNIKLENTGYGIRIHSSASDGSVDDTYNGGFKVAKVTVDDVPHLKVVYGEPPALIYCGAFRLGSVTLQVPVVTFPITAEKHYITLKLTYNSTLEAYEAEILITNDTLPTTPDTDTDPYLFFYLASYSGGTVSQIYKVLGDDYSIDLNGKYWV